MISNLGVTALSGLYDLVPIQLSHVNIPIGMSKQEAIDCSPLHSQFYSADPGGWLLMNLMNIMLNFIVWSMYGRQVMMLFNLSSYPVSIILVFYLNYWIAKARCILYCSIDPDNALTHLLKCGFGIDQHISQKSIDCTTIPETSS